MFTNNREIEHPYIMENHIPVPSDDDHIGRRKSRYSFLTTMKVGESFLADNKIMGYRLETLVQSAYELKKKNGYEFRYRTVSGSSKRSPSWVIRLWRTK